MTKAQRALTAMYVKGSKEKKLVENLGKSDALGPRKRRRIRPKPVPKKTASRPESEEALDESNIFGEREELAIEPIAPGRSSL